MEKSYSYQRLLKRELQERLKKNSRYSLRAFAKSLKMDVGDLSRILNGSKVITPHLTKKILPQLSLSQVEAKEFSFSMAEAYEKKGTKRSKVEIKEILKKGKKRDERKDLSSEVFSIIADWQHFALLQLTQTENFSSDIKWIASQLELPEMEVKLALERLERLEMIKIEGKNISRTSEALTTGDPTHTTSALRKRIKQVTEKSLQALENCPIEKRNHTTMTIAIDPDQIPLAKEMIQDFMDKLETTLQTKKKTVYELQINLFPLTKV